MTGLVVAAGGGGDAITAAALPGVAAVLTYSWDRLLVDPLPGPRTAADFTGLLELAPGLFEVMPQAQSRPPAGSSLPELAAELPVRLLLLDPSGGAVGMARQVRFAAEIVGAEQVSVLDVGGDILTDGRDPGLRSPLADQLALAAVLRAGIPGHVVVAGPGLDGEIDPSTLARRIRDLRGVLVDLPGGEALDRVRRVLAWHPSEASGMFTAAAGGLRGRVQVRDAGDIVAMDDRSATMHRLELQAVVAVVPAARMTDTRSLDDAGALVAELTGLSELSYEARKARTFTPGTREPDVGDLEAADRHAAEARRSGADYVSLRRLAELVGIRSAGGYRAFGTLLRHHRPGRYHHSLYGTTDP